MVLQNALKNDIMMQGQSNAPLILCDAETRLILRLRMLETCVVQVVVLEGKPKILMRPNKHEILS